MNASPYKEDDLYRPADEGCSLHDDSRAYYQEVMMVSAVGGISNSQNDSIENLHNRVTIVNDNFVSLQNKVTIAESKLEKIDSGMKTILDFIKNK